jgi:peptide deformylase
MALYEIAQIGDPILRDSARELTVEELRERQWQDFIDNLVETMRAAKGSGIAAPQVRTPVRICVLEVAGSNPRYPYKPPIPLTIAINPIVRPLSEETFLNYEGCLSVPNLRGLVRRFVHVHVTYLDRDGETQEFEAKGLTAGTWQHEVDHLHGILFPQRVEDPASLCTWENFNRHHRDAFIASLEALDT